MKRPASLQALPDRHVHDARQHVDVVQAHDREADGHLRGARRRIRVQHARGDLDLRVARQVVVKTLFAIAVGKKMRKRRGGCPRSARDGEVRRGALRGCAGRQHEQ
jgi:hypothetical protein